MALTTLLRGITQIRDNTVSLAKLVADFLGGSDWDITNSNNDATITGLREPTADKDAATKKYVDDNAVGATQVKPSVRAATTAAGTLATDFENGDTIDGVTLATSDRILIKNQSSASENGIYVVAASGAPSRASDFDETSEVTYASVWVREGTANADTKWLQTAVDPVIDTGDINFTKVYPTNAANAQADFTEGADWNLTNNNNDATITGLANPTNDRDAVNLQYLQGAVNDDNWKADVRAATTANGTLATDFENGDTLDGVVTLATGDRILIKDQTSAEENGIYTVNASGAPTRAVDADTGDRITYASVWVREGTENNLTAWVQAAPVSTIGVDIQEWSLFSDPTKKDHWKEPVRAATTANGALATDFENGDTIDGVTLATGDRILIKDQTSKKTNGIYVVQSSGAPVRADDAAKASDLTKAPVWVDEGTVNAATAWVQTEQITVLGTDDVEFLKFFPSSASSVQTDFTEGTDWDITGSNNDATITGLKDPANDRDAVNLQYLVAELRKRKWKDSVRVATTANGTLATDFENGDTIDGVTLATDDRILLKDQTAGAENGIYTVNASGAPTRAVDFDASNEVNMASVWVEEGTANGDTAWVQTAIDPTIDTTALSFTKFAPAAAGGGSDPDFMQAYNASVSSSFTAGQQECPLDTTQDSNGSSFTQTSNGIRADFTGTVDIVADIGIEHPAGGGQDFFQCDITKNGTNITAGRAWIFLRQATGYNQNASITLKGVSVSTNDIIRIEAERQVASATWAFAAESNRLLVTKRG